jgi:hypothetical protein
VGFKVMKEQCDECLFSPQRIVSARRMAQLLKECCRDDTHFICHKATIEGKEACCRAFYDQNPGATNLMRIAGRLNAVEFVTIDDLRRERR